MKKVEYVKIEEIDSSGHRKIYTLRLLTKEELESFNTRHILSCKGINGKEQEGWEKQYITFKTNSQGGLPYYCAVNKKDFYDVLESRPHIPNKKESKELRKKRIKEGK